MLCYTIHELWRDYMHYQVGQIVEGVITGIQPYGAFVALDNKTTGLIHISEISDGFVKDVAIYVKVNDRIKVKIIDFDEKNNQARLSLKAVYPNKFRRDRKNSRYGSLPAMKLGFLTIEKNMDKWIREAKEKHYDQI